MQWLLHCAHPIMALQALCDLSQTYLFSQTSYSILSSLLNPQNYPLAPNVPSAFSLVPSLICFSLSLECPLLPHHFCPLILEDTA